MVSFSLLNKILFFWNLPGKNVNTSQTIDGIKADIGFRGCFFFGSGTFQAATGTIR